MQVFENYNLIHNVITDNMPGANATISFRAFNIPDSLTLNSVAMLISLNSSRSATISFGLYSFTGSTLTLVDSASGLISSSTTSPLIWSSLSISASYNIVPGTWYFAILGSFNPNVQSAAYYNDALNLAQLGSGLYGGAPIAGGYSTTTAALPASLNVTEILIGAGGNSNAMHFPYILISA